ncbi:MAG: hypothetical protein HKP59_08250 [Lutibacter sp.]|uniref:hypothetical protein n=1 Tax=Lutibacter sp. TaxID=1925666 RepID=UPI00183C1323|nr:hypothetical protein [Lutibacter sp.]MBT8317604.1 hypothetical protein [Lutibacter sp.]NNJ58463.1 hypothetical protein [Lutibacter sp.]
MKKSFRKLVVMLFLGTSLLSNANNVSTGIIMYGNESKSVVLDFENFDGSIEVSIKNSFGLTLFKEKFQGVKFSNKYDLTSLPNGNYFFEINGQTKIKVLPFIVNEASVSFEREKEEIYYKPIVREYKKNIFSISMVALGEKNLKIALYDADSNLIYNEELQDDVYLGRLINISNLNLGKYKLVMKSNNRTFVETIRKEK